ncbi:hypothetical protein KFK09_011622 [Dendrobium nobile]|uniref:Uncharacterized protein n=1 Tax=Dendrobium nobile TaxID=94219 RepID=A0A8T3BF35_DENNO|nr:hypothetical protein KFK09_011622 [Dendrobium nobile]
MEPASVGHEGRARFAANFCFSETMRNLKFGRNTSSEQGYSRKGRIRKQSIIIYPKVLDVAFK